MIIILKHFQLKTVNALLKDTCHSDSLKNPGKQAGLPKDLQGSSPPHQWGHDRKSPVSGWCQMSHRKWWETKQMSYFSWSTRTYGKKWYFSYAEYYRFNWMTNSDFTLGRADVKRRGSFSVQQLPVCPVMVWLMFERLSWDWRLSWKQFFAKKKVLHQSSAYRLYLYI